MVGMLMSPAKSERNMILECMGLFSLSDQVRSQLRPRGRPSCSILEASDCVFSELGKPGNHGACTGAASEDELSM